MQVSEGRIVSPTAGSLAETIAALLDGAEYAQLAVGYLFVAGLTPLIAPMHSLKRVDLLIGNVVNRLTEEQLMEDSASRTTAAVGPEGDAFAKTVRDERDRVGALTALNLRRTLENLPKTEATKQLVPNLAKLIAGGKMHVRLHTQGRLHAKVALVGYPAGHADAPGVAVVGSSNITLPVERSMAPLPNLDILLTGQSNFRTLTDWYQAHWAVAQDFQKELFEELGRCWPLG